MELFCHQKEFGLQTRFHTKGHQELSVCSPKIVAFLMHLILLYLFLSIQYAFYSLQQPVPSKPSVAVSGWLSFYFSKWYFHGLVFASEIEKDSSLPLYYSPYSRGKNRLILFFAFLAVQWSSNNLIDILNHATVLACWSFHGLLQAFEDLYYLF